MDCYCGSKWASDLAYRVSDLPSVGRSPTAASPKDDDATPVKEEDDIEVADLASGHSMPTGLAAIAEAAEHASPFSSELKVSCCTTYNETGLRSTHVCE